MIESPDAAGGAAFGPQAQPTHPRAAPSPSLKHPSQSPPSRSVVYPPKSPIPAWLDRLWSNQRVPLSGEQRYWWSVHVRRFLKFVDSQRLDGPPEVLAQDFLQDLAVRQPPASEWHRDQVRQALEVFARGISHWHRTTEASGRERIAFRLKPPTEDPSATAADSGVSGTGGATPTASEPDPRPRPASPFPVPTCFRRSARGGVPGDDPGQDPPAVAEAATAASWRQEFTKLMRVRHYSLRTEEAYRGWIERFVQFHGGAAPEALGEAEVREFLEYLVVARNVSASTQNQAFSALLFLYETVLDRPLGKVGEVVRARRPARLPVVLSREEVRKLLGGMEGTLGLIARLLYGTGLRLMEGLRLRVKDVDFDRGLITVREGKGDKDRMVMLPAALREPLQAHLMRVRLLWESDRAANLPGVWMPDATPATRSQHFVPVASQPGRLSAQRAETDHRFLRTNPFGCRCFHRTFRGRNTAELSHSSDGSQARRGRRGAPKLSPS